MPGFNNTQQYKRIAYLGVSFMMLFAAFGNFENIVSQIYEEYQFDNMGQTAIMFLYGIFCLTSLVSSYIVKKLNYQMSFFMSGLTYIIFEVASLVIVTEIAVPRSLKWIIVIIGASICGVGSSVLWTTQGSYVSTIADPTNKS